MAEFHLSVKPCRPEWMDFGFIDKCYEVDEQIFDPDIFHELVSARIQALNIPFDQRAFTSNMRSEYDYVVWATYGLGPGRGLFKGVKYQVAEKILLQLPPVLQGISLVVVDGPFTAFDPYGSSPQSLLASAKNTTHWTTTLPDEPIPEMYRPLLNRPDFEPFTPSRFEAMRQDSSLPVPASKDAVYLGSRFTIRVVEDNPAQDRRTLYILEKEKGEIVVFSGKVVSAVKAARLITQRISEGVKT